uniref:hypothetical protein n=1 Tax=Yersinia enterocolitica TaxID=630 RepID=UPI0020C59DDC
WHGRFNIKTSITNQDRVVCVCDQETLQKKGRFYIPFIKKKKKKKKNWGKIRIIKTNTPKI